MRTFLIFSLGTLVAMADSTAQAKPKTLWHSFGPGMKYDTSNASTISGPRSTTGAFSSGFLFTPSETAHLDAIEVSVSVVSGTNAFYLSLRAADGPDGGPGTILESFQVIGKMKPFGMKNPLIRVESSSEHLLKAGTKYWLVATAEGDTHGAWNLGNKALSGIFFSIQGGREVLLPNQAVGGYSIFGTPLP